MCIIVVSASPFSGAEALARTLADELSFAYVDESAVVETAVAQGGDQTKLIQVLAGRPRLLRHLSHQPHIHLARLRGALADQVSGRDAVCFGRVAALLSLDAPDVLRIRVERPDEERLEEARRSLGLDLMAAERQVRRCDRAARDWRRYVYHSGNEAPPEDDLRLDLGNTTIDDACSLVSFVVHQPRYAPTEATRAAIDDWVLATRVKAALTSNPATAHATPVITVTGGRVSVTGGVHQVSDIMRLGTVVAGVPGVNAADLANVCLVGDEFIPADFEASASDGPPSPLSRRPFASRSLPALVGATTAAVLVTSLIFVRAGQWAERAWFARGRPVQAFAGVVTDSDCGARDHADKPVAQCVRSCVEQTGAKYALWDGSRVLVLSDQRAAAFLAGRHVVVTGSVDARRKTIDVRTMDAVPDPPIL